MLRNECRRNVVSVGDIRGGLARLPPKGLATVTPGACESVLGREAAARRTLTGCHSKKTASMDLARIVRGLSNARRSKEEEDAG